MITVYEDEGYRISALAESGYIVFKLARSDNGVVNPLDTEAIYDSRACEWEENDDIDRLPDKIKQELLKELI